MTQQTFITPAGHEARMEYRDGTSDWNTIAACLRNPMANGPETGDEYHLPSGLSGWGLDVGAHIGSVIVGFLLDNPDAKCVAIEGVPENVYLIRKNLTLNDLNDRAVVIHGIAWDGEGRKTIEYGYSGSEVATVHQFIGSVTPWLDRPKGTKVMEADLPIVTLEDALSYTEGQGFAWVKSDCEGCEHRFFRGQGLKQLAHIEGEWHQRDGGPEAFAKQLSKTHDVTWGKGIGGGPFVAHRKP